jgi:arylformamidase
MNQAATMQRDPARPLGPLVWLDMDQKALDDAYDQMVYAPNRDQVHKRNMFNSDRVRARLGAPKRIAYGSKPIEALDLFATPRLNPPVQAGEGKEGVPINVFIHGGAWRLRSAKDYAFMAEMYARAGAHWIALDFDGVEGTGGDLLPMVDQVRRGVAWVYKNARSFGGDPSRIYVSGQSSGAHLAGCVVTTDWQKDYGVPANIVKGALLCSGMYDLKPVRLSKRSDYVAFTDESEEKLSSQRRLDRLNCPVIVAYGTYETPEFQRQNREFAAAVKAAGLPVTLLVGEGYNHFEMAEMIGNPLSLLGSAVLAQMGL